MRHADSVLLMSVLAATCSVVGCGIESESESNSAEQTDQALSRADAGPPEHKLIAWAALPQAERTPGPTSGQFSTPANGVIPPFVDSQPVPGWSGLLEHTRGTFVAMPDNGFGAKGNSADYVLGFYVIDPAFKTRSDGTSQPGPVANKSFTAFNDRRSVLNNGVGVELTISADLANYRSGAGTGTDSGLPVAPSIRQQRLLTGYDFDIESITRAHDGSFWVGEERSSRDTLSVSLRGV